MAFTLHVGTRKQQLQTCPTPGPLPTQGQAAPATLFPQAAPESHQAQLRETEEGRSDHSKGAEKKRLSVKPELGPSSRWHSSSEESSERKTA